MNQPNLLIVGIKGSVVALDRDTGNQVWETRLASSTFVNVMVDGGLVFAATNGEVFCLEFSTGRRLWQNPLRGKGLGLVTMATGFTSQGPNAGVLAEKHQQQARAAANAATTGSVCQ